MESLLTVILPYIAPGALPLIIVILGVVYIQSKRKETKLERDKDSQNIHDDILKLQFDVCRIKDDLSHTNVVQEDLQKQISVLSDATAKLSVSVEHFSECVKELREELKELRGRNG